MEAGLLRDALTLLLGFATGVLSALFGIGGAIVSNPGLRALGADPLVAVGTTLPSILPGAISGTLRYRREGLIDWRLVTPAAAAGLLAVVGGSLLSHAVPGEGHLLLLLIAVLLAFTAWRTAVTAPTPADGPDHGGSGGGAGGGSGAGVEARTGRGDGRPGDVDNREHPNSGSATLPLPESSQAGRLRWRAAGIGVVAGLLSGLLGIGGGVIMVPAFTELLYMPLKSAIATSLVCVGIFGVPATITHAFLGDVDWRLAALLTIGVVPGARVGASLTIRTAERRLRLAVGVFLALVALVYFVTETRALLEQL
ncbi:MAG TPA: sulfite exporter TauE/SafE family protein [Actinomycetes bacterium]|nr:sulfite exporter TauE/SafE family protein [Actinomycetes bacterium]